MNIGALLFGLCSSPLRLLTVLLGVVVNDGNGLLCGIICGYGHWRSTCDFNQPSRWSLPDSLSFLCGWFENLQWSSWSCGPFALWVCRWLHLWRQHLPPSARSATCSSWHWWTLSHDMVPYWAVHCSTWVRVQWNTISVGFHFYFDATGTDYLDWPPFLKFAMTACSQMAARQSTQCSPVERACGPVS